MEHMMRMINIHGKQPKPVLRSDAPLALYACFVWKMNNLFIAHNARAIAHILCTFSGVPPQSYCIYCPALRRHNRGAGGMSLILLPSSFTFGPNFTHHQNRCV